MAHPAWGHLGTGTLHFRAEATAKDLTNNKKRLQSPTRIKQMTRKISNVQVNAGQQLPIALHMPGS